MGAVSETAGPAGMNPDAGFKVLQGYYNLWRVETTCGWTKRILLLSAESSYTVMSIHVKDSRVTHRQELGSRNGRTGVIRRVVGRVYFTVIKEE